MASKAENAVTQGHASSVSAWFSDIARREPDWATAQAVAAELAEEAGVTDEHRSWARGALGLDESLHGAA